MLITLLLLALVLFNRPIMAILILGEGLSPLGTFRLPSAWSILGLDVFLLAADEAADLSFDSNA